MILEALLASSTQRLRLVDPRLRPGVLGELDQLGRGRLFGRLVAQLGHQRRDAIELGRVRRDERRKWFHRRGADGAHHLLHAEHLRASSRAMVEVVLRPIDERVGELLARRVVGHQDRLVVGEHRDRRVFVGDTTDRRAGCLASGARAGTCFICATRGGTIPSIDLLALVGRERGQRIDQPRLMPIRRPVARLHPKQLERRPRHAKANRICRGVETATSLSGPCSVVPQRLTSLSLTRHPT